MSDNFTFYTNNLIKSATNTTYLRHNYTASSWSTFTAGDYSGFVNLYDRKTAGVTLTATSQNDFVYLKYDLSDTSGTDTISSIIVKGSCPNGIAVGMLGVSGTGYNFASMGTPVLTNSASYYIFEFDKTLGANIAIQVTNDLTATLSAEYTIEEIIVNNKLFEISRNPNYSNYKPINSGMRDSKEMADGGYVTVQTVLKYAFDLKLTYVNQSDYNSLYGLWNTSASYVFVPFPTATNWDGVCPKVNWIGDFNFELAYNARTEPLYNGVIKLKETPL